MTNTVYNHELFLFDDARVESLKQSSSVDDQCLLGRWYWITAPTDDYAQRAEECFRKAIDGGNVEARLHLGNMYRLGELGPVDLDRYYCLRDSAIADGCVPAEIRLCCDIAYGVGQLPNLDEAIAEAKRRLEAGTDDDPRWYDQIGWFYLNKGESKVANEYFLKAIERGYYDSYSGLVGISQSNDMGIRAGCADCLVFKADDMAQEYSNIPEQQNLILLGPGTPEEKQRLLDKLTQRRDEIRNTIEEMYEKAAKLGSTSAYYYLGCIFFKGQYGRQMDDERAWNYFYKGMQQGNPSCTAMLAELIEDSRDPGGEKEWEDACNLRLKALRCGDDSQLEKVVSRYQRGQFGEDESREIELYYLPRYKEMEDELRMNPNKFPENWLEDWPEDSEDDYEDDDGRYDAWA